MPGGLKGYRALGLRYMPTAENAKRIKEVMILAGSPQEPIDAYFEPASNSANISAYRLVRILSGYWHTLNKCLLDYGLNCKPTHLMMFTPNSPDKIRVFQTLKLDKTDKIMMDNAGAFTYPQVLDTLVSQINADMKNEAKAKGWKILSRARTRLKKYEDISVDRALMQFTNARDRHSEADVKRFAANIVDSRRPVEIKFAKSPREIYDMYHSGPKSCMTVGGDNPDRHWSSIKFDNYHPCMFFHYHPYVRGSYITRADGTVRARAWLYTAENGNEYYGRIYGSIGTDVQALRTSLELQGIMEVPHEFGSNPKGGGFFWRDAEFTIPGIEWKGSYAMPFPYLDNLKGNLQIKYDEKTHMFSLKTYSYKAGKKETPWGGYETVQNGYVLSSQVLVCNCAHCGGPVDTQGHPGAYVDPDMGERYCSDNCISRAGKMLAVDGAAQNRIVSKDVAVKDPVTEMWHTNMQSIIDLGGKLFIEDILFMPEEDTYTRSGNVTDHYAFKTASHKYAWQEAKVKSMQNLFYNNAVKKQAQIEIDFDKFPGFKMTGEFVDAFEGEVLPIDPIYGYAISGKTNNYEDIIDGKPVGHDCIGDKYYIKDVARADQEIA